MQIRRRTLPLNPKRHKKRQRMNSRSESTIFECAGFRPREPWEVYGYGVHKTELDKIHFSSVNQLIRSADPDFMSDYSGRVKGIALKKKTKLWLTENMGWKPKRSFSSPPELRRRDCSPKIQPPPLSGSLPPGTRQRCLSASSEPLSQEEFTWCSGEDCSQLEIAVWEEYDRIYLAYFYDC